MPKKPDPADLDKIIKLVETAMKTEAKQAKLREQQRKKAEAALEAFKDNYAEYNKETIARVKGYTSDLKKAVGIAQRDLPKDHPLTKKLNDMIDLVAKLNFDRKVDELNKAIVLIEDWDVALEKLDQPKKAISSIEGAKESINASIAAKIKATDEFNKIGEAARKDLESVDDPDVKKELAAILEGEL
jgi:hypothetical protein